MQQNFLTKDTRDCSLQATWVYNDAEQRGNENAALWALAVGGLTFLTFFGGFLALAVYIWDRE